MRIFSKIFFVAVLVLLACQISVVERAAAADGTAAWSVASVSGKAQLRATAQAWQPLAKGQKVAVGQPIRTGDDGRVLLSRGDESVTIAPNSSFEMKPAADGMLTTIFQKVGTLMFRVHKMPNRHFEVKTPYLVAAVKGTHFTVSVDSSGGAVHVTEGLVQVADLNGADKVLVRPGITASVSSQRGSRVQIGETPEKNKDMKGKSSHGARIDRDLGPATVDVAHSSNGLFRSQSNPSAEQTAARGKGNDGDNDGNNGKALGKDNSLANNVGNGLGLANGNGNAGGNGNGNAGGNGVANGSAGGQGNGNAGGNGNGNGNAGGNGNGRGNGHGHN